MKHRCSKKKCIRYAKICCVWAAIFNNTPLGFLSEHLFWEKLPFVSAIPRVLGIH